jgi:hypothetical protein
MCVRLPEGDIAPQCHFCAQTAAPHLGPLTRTVLLGIGSVRAAYHWSLMQAEIRRSVRRSSLASYGAGRLRGFRICKAQSSIVSLLEEADGRSIHSGLRTVLVIQVVAGPPGPAA